MARPNKTGLDYFPMDVNTDFKFELIEAKHGLIGFAVVVKLYQLIYKAGYFTPWNEEMLLIFKKSVNLEIDKVQSIIDDCFHYQIFDRDQFDKHGILTSAGIQKRYLSACERRKQIEMTKKYIVVDVNQFNANINWVDDDKNEQSEPVVDPPKPKTKEPELNNIPDNFRLVVHDWLVYKRSRRESYKSDQSINAFFKKLYSMAAGDPEKARKIVEQSLANNWAGIFELKDYGKTWRDNHSERRKEELIAEAAAISNRVS